MRSLELITHAFANASTSAREILGVDGMDRSLVPGIPVNFDRRTIGVHCCIIHALNQ